MIIKKLFVNSNQRSQMNTEKISIYILVLSSTIFSHVETKISMDIDDNNREWKAILEDFITHHEGYQILAFYQNETLFETQLLLKILPSAQIYNNLDLFWNKFISSEKSLNIFFISDYKMDFRVEMKIFQKYSHNIFLTFKIDEEFCISDFAKLVPASFILDIGTNQLLSCFDRKENLQLTPILPSELTDLQGFHRNFTDLRGTTLKIYHANYLSLRCRKDSPPDVCILEGPDLMIINALSESLNFVPDIQRYHFKNYSTIWEEILHAVNSGEADFVAGSVLVVANRTAYFTSYTWSAPLYGTLFIDPTRELGLWIVTDTFDSSSYMVTIIVFFTILFVMAVSSQRCNNQFDIYQNLMALLKVFVEQGTSLNRIFNPTPTKYLFSLWLILNIIISTSLKSILSTALIKPNTYGLTTTDDLIKNRFWFLVDDWFTEFFKGNSYFKEIRDVYFVSYSNNPNQCRDSTVFFQFKLALVHTEFSLVYLSRNCEKLYPIDKIQNLRFIKDVEVYHAYPMKPDSPYRGIISRTIGRLHASGLIPFWYWNITLESLRVKDMGYTFRKPLTIRHLFSFFAILLGGLLISAVIFTLEIIKGRKSNKLKRRH